LNLDNFVDFESDGTSTMVGVYTRLKKEVNPLLTIVHCIANRTNLAALQDASTKPCDVMSSSIDDLMNSLAAHFKNLVKKSMFAKTLGGVV